MENDNPTPPIINPPLRVGDRVECLDLTGEGRWGTIVSPDVVGAWLVLDNVGKADSHMEINLRRACRAGPGHVDVGLSGQR